MTKSLLDVLIVPVGLGALSWSVFVVPSAHLAHQPALDKRILIVYLLAYAPYGTTVAEW